MNLTKQFLMLALPVFLAACFAPAILFAQTDVSAFIYAADNNVAQLTARTASNQQAVQSWPITLSDEFRQLTQGRTFIVPLPSGGIITAQVTSRAEYDNGDVQLIASINNGGSIVITMGEEVAFGSINDGVVSYSIGLNNNQQVSLVDNQAIQNEIDLSEDMRFPSTSPFDGSSGRSATSLEGLKIRSAQNTSESTIDLLVVYSNEFANLTVAPETRINQLVSFTNTSYDDSGILINLRLVGAVALSFDNTSFETSFNQVFADLDIILDDATDGVGDFSTLPALRNQYGADLVVILSGNTSGSSAAAGLAWLNGGNPNLGFSTNMLSNNCCDSVFAHELGHNLGSGHEYSSVNPDLNTNNQCNTNFTFTNFSCGHGNYISPNNNNNWGTIMSNFSNKANIGYLFSNTDNDCLGSPCGIAQGNAEAADNRTSFNMSRLLVAEFRDEATTETPNNSESGWLPGVLFNLLDDEPD